MVNSLYRVVFPVSNKTLNSGDCHGKEHSMKELQIFDNAEFGKIRTLFEDGKVLFCAKDVATALGYKDTVNAIKQHCRGVVKRHLIDSLGRDQETSFIPEGDVYRLTFSSKLQNAEHFTDYVTEEVLPSIRKTGGYQARPMTQAELILAQSQLMVEQERRLTALESRFERTEGTMQRTMDIFSAPACEADDWCEKMNHEINTIVEQYGLNHQTFRSELYAQVEQEAGVDIGIRQKRRRNRMKENGATTTECKNVSKLSIVGSDKKLRAIFESVLRRRAAKLLSSGELIRREA